MQRLILPNTAVVVLIDTWWNVNYYLSNNHDQSNKVLIDTWWNVNFQTLLSYTQGGHSFNRYMVECE